MWTPSQQQPRTATVTLLLLCCFPAFQESAFCSSRKNAKSHLASSGTSAYSHAWNSVAQIIKASSLPSFDWNSYNPPSHHPDGIKSFLVVKLCAIKRYVCPCSTVTVLCLELMSFLCHPPVSMFIKFSGQERPVPCSFHVLHFCLPGGGSSLQTCRWCSPFRHYEWEGWEQAGLAHCCTHRALRQH